MITNNALTFRNDDQYAQDLLLSLGIAPASINSSPFCSAALVNVTVNTSFYDLALKRAFTSQASFLQTSRTLYIGSLYIKNYCTVFAAAALQTLTIVNVVDGSAISTVLDQRTLAAVETPNKDREFYYPQIAFQAIVNTFDAAAGNTVRNDISFVGTKYQF